MNFSNIYVQNCIATRTILFFICLRSMIKFIIVSTIVLSMLILAYFFFVDKIENVETQKYYLENKDGQIEIRTYEQSIIARTSIYGDYKESSGTGFRKLAGYIFGGNNKGKKIAMTSPVWMSNDSKNSEMHFIMPSDYEMNELPKPLDNTVMLDVFNGGRYAAIRFGGFANEEKIESYQKKLIQWLEENDYEPSGESFYVGYNSPFKIYNRRNEILIALN